MVGKVLSQRQPTVGVEVRQHLDGREERSVFIGAFVEVVGIRSRPPVGHVTVLVIVTALVVKAVSHLMSYHNADSSVIECVVSCRVKEWHLQYAGRETDFVCRGVVVCIDRLRRHKPLVLVNGLACTVVNIPLRPELAAVLHVLIERELGVDCQSRHVFPLVRIANLHVEGVELVESCLLRFGAHPVLRLDALAKRYLQVLHEFLHPLL